MQAENGSRTSWGFITVRSFSPPGNPDDYLKYLALSKAIF